MWSITLSDATGPEGGQRGSDDVGNPWLERRVLCFAHQGGALEFPSSTLFAIESALELGATAIELDVHATADGLLVVSHDPTIDRTSDRSGSIAELLSLDLAGVDNAYWFVPGENAVVGRAPGDYPYRGLARTDERFGIASLQTVLERFPGVLLNLDIKRSAPDVTAYEDDLAELLLEYERTDDVIVTSFNDASVAAFHRLAPEISIAPGANALTAGIQGLRGGGKLDASLFADCVALQVPDRVAGVQIVDERLVSAAHACELAIHVWTVDDSADMKRLVDLGVDGVMTDRPSVLAALLERRGVTWRNALG
jgi:glycerophosphoryl diester phosphodiesterase